MKNHGILTFGLAFSLSCTAAQQVPPRKPGLWEIVLEDQSVPQENPATLQQCIDKASDMQTLLSIAPGQENCENPNVILQGTRYHITSSCAVHDQQVDMSMELLGDFQQRYEGRYHVRYAGNQKVDTRNFKARWLAPCSSGMQPGDLVLPNGILVNTLQKHQHDHDDNHDNHKGHDHN